MSDPQNAELSVHKLVEPLEDQILSWCLNIGINCFFQKQVGAHHAKVSVPSVLSMFEISTNISKIEISL